ncbi:hypothetical protein CCYA_CCYA16G4099 [Cyanidiococcus yangmingshanensis]|nr:hypothetical protein CCYA_CCYA16G4099 [Cyanidiococcus yangmingshanensis]
MGGTPRYPYPRDVWSPMGGWWPHPRAWRRNTAIAAFGIVLVLTPVFIYSERIGERPAYAKRRIPWRPNVPVRDGAAQEAESSRS